MLKTYMNNIIELSRSMIIHFIECATSINNSLLLSGDHDPDLPKSKWKYYLNISGEKHHTNKDVLLYITELGSYEYLSKDLLLTYPETHKLLINRETIYKDLELRYPLEQDYIHGCISPIPIDVAINSPNGTILHWNRDLLGDNEFQIMRSVEGDIKRLIKRWYVVEYNITDELYIHSFMALIWSTIPSIILKHKIKNIGLPSVDIFNLECKFNSNLELWDDVKLLNERSVMWLYNNVETLVNNIGREDVTSVIIDRLLTDNSVGVGGVKLNNLIADVVSEPDLVMLESYAMNTHFSSIDMIPETVVQDMLLSDSNLSVSHKLAYASNYNQLKPSNLPKQDTKLLIVDRGELGTSPTINQTFTIIEAWTTLAYTTSLTLNYVDPNDNSVIKLSYNEGLYLFYHCLDTMFNDTPTIVTNLTYIRLEPTLRTDILLRYSDSKYVSIIEDLLTYQPDINSVKDEATSLAYVSDYLNYVERVKIVTSNLGDVSVSSVAKDVLKDNITRNSVILSNDTTTTLLNLLSSDGINLTFGADYDYKTSAIEVFKLFTGLDLFPHEKSLDELAAYAKLLNKLTSYSTVTKPPTYLSKLISVDSASEGIYHPDNGIINVTNVEVTKALEDNDGVVHGVGNNFKETSDSTVVVSGIRVIDITPPHFKAGVISEGVSTTPSFMVELESDNIVMLSPSIAVNTNSTNSAVVVNILDTPITEHLTTDDALTARLEVGVDSTKINPTVTVSLSH